MIRRNDSTVMDMKKIGILLLASTFMLTACGKRSDGTELSGEQAQFGANGEQISGNPDLGAAVAATLNVRVLSDRSQIATGGSDVANITALVTNEKNQAVANQLVDISSTGGVLQAISTATDENGEAGATLVLAQDYEQQDIQITVEAEGFTGSVVVQAVGSVLEISGPSVMALGDEGELVITLEAGNQEPIANQELVFSSTAGNSITPATAFTDADGRVSITVGTVSGDDTIRVSALNGSVTDELTFSVNEDLLAFENGVENTEFAVGSVNEVQVSWLSQGLPVVGQPLRFAITAGQVLSQSVVNTNADGEASVTITSSSAGPATLSVESDMGDGPATNVDVEFIATTPGLLSVDSSATRVPTRDTSTITALVSDANGNPVRDIEVVFSSPDLKGGQLNRASAKTNDAGEADVTFTAGNLATEFNEIEIAAEVEGSTINSLTYLTVVERVLNVTIGTANLLEDRGAGTQYAIPFVVQVADGGGNPLENADVELSITPLTYSKGYYRLVDRLGFPYDGVEENWAADHWGIVAQQCESEDNNGNRILDAGEDSNANNILDPQDPATLAPIASVDSEDLATLIGGSLSTDATGSGYFELVYPKSNAHWYTIRITARAQALGVEAESSFLTTMPVLATRILDETVDPPNRYSPNGVLLDCSNTI